MLVRKKISHHLTPDPAMSIISGIVRCHYLVMMFNSSLTLPLCSVYVLLQVVMPPLRLLQSGPNILIAQMHNECALLSKTQRTLHRRALLRLPPAVVVVMLLCSLVVAAGVLGHSGKGSALHTRSDSRTLNDWRCQHHLQRPQRMHHRHPTSARLPLFLQLHLHHQLRHHCLQHCHERQ